MDKGVAVTMGDRIKPKTRDCVDDEDGETPPPSRPLRVAVQISGDELSPHRLTGWPDPIPTRPTQT